MSDVLLLGCNGQLRARGFFPRCQNAPINQMAFKGNCNHSALLRLLHYLIWPPLRSRHSANYIPGIFSTKKKKEKKSNPIISLIIQMNPCEMMPARTTTTKSPPPTPTTPLFLALVRLTSARGRWRALNESLGDVFYS